MVVTVRGKEIEVTRVTNDVNGNPRFVVWFGDLGLTEYKSTPLTRRLGLRVYRGRDFGGGFVFTSYNVERTLGWMLDEIANQK